MRGEKRPWLVIHRSAVRLALFLVFAAGFMWGFAAAVLLVR